MENGFEMARTASGLTLDQAADAAGLSRATYPVRRKNSPGEFRLKELRGLYRAMNDTSRGILLEAIVKNICS